MKDIFINMREILEMLDNEIQWCNENKNIVSEDESKGFINGLKQAKLFIEQYAADDNDEKFDDDYDDEFDL